MTKKRIDRDTVAQWIDTIGREIVLRELGIHRSTLARWINGSRRPPRAAALLLRLWASGRLPGMGADWIGFRFRGDRLYLPDSRVFYTAREIDGWHYQRAALDALQAKCARLEAQLIAEVQRAPNGSANDRYTSAQDPRARAFNAA